MKGRTRSSACVLGVGIAVVSAFGVASWAGRAELRQSAVNPDYERRRAYRDKQEMLPKLGECEKVEIADPVAAAASNVSKGDLRPWFVPGPPVVPGAYPPNPLGIFCPAGDYWLVSRGGALGRPNACGSGIFANADRGQMLAYNRALAHHREFQEASGCRPSTDCEERYRKYQGSQSRTPDPLCPNEPIILMRIADQGTPDELRRALPSEDLDADQRRDLLTLALSPAITSAAWDNVKLLVAAGADVNGRLASVELAQHFRPSPPLTAVFASNVGDDRAKQLEMARWLMAKGATIEKSNAHGALTIAASQNDVEQVDFLLGVGASPNGELSKDALDALASGEIETGDGEHAYGFNPFYSALGRALDFSQTVRLVPKERVWAKAEVRKALTNAVRLYRAGGRFVVGKLYERPLHENPSLEVASILLAAAEREGRLRELADRIIAFGVFRLDTQTPEQSRLLRYVEAVRDCPRLAIRPMNDHIKLCAEGSV